MRALALLALLAACDPGGAPPGADPYRDATVAMASKADFDADRFAGRWHEVARFSDPATAGCAGIVTEWARSAAGFDVARACLGPGGDTLGTATGTATVAPLGRLTLTLDGVTVPHWVLWADADYRTAILALPDGRGAAILDRGRTPPADRLRAALEVLDFNGFDTGALVFGGAVQGAPSYRGSSSRR